MNKKTKLALIILIIATIVGIIIIKKNQEKDGVYFKNRTYNRKINPISKETAINIIKAEYGDLVIVDKDKIKIENNQYIIELFAQTKDESHEHEKSIGIHKIDIYTGNMTFVKNNPLT